MAFLPDLVQQALPEPDELRSGSSPAEVRRLSKTYSDHTSIVELFHFFARQYVTLLFVSDQNRFFCCWYFISFFFPNLSGIGLLVAAVGIRRDKQRGASTQREMERGREELRERASGICQYNTCTVLSFPLQTQLADAVPAQTMRPPPARKRQCLKSEFVTCHSI